MLIRISGGAGGIKEYLETGQKQDRFYTRNELDERLILDGDLLLTDTIISTMDKDSNKYFHITLAFKEDYLEPATLANINQEFKEFFLAGYAEDEINYYAEAHLPKIKSYKSIADGKLIERKPHIHIVIPRLSLIDDVLFNPFIPHIKKYINSFQEHINAKYGLESPKDNLRTDFNHSSEVIARHNGDMFATRGREQKLAILDLILKHNPTSMEQFRTVLAKNGYMAKLRNKDDATSCYLNVKRSGDAKGMNLKDAVFSDAFLRLPLNEKLAKLNQPTGNQYIHSSILKETDAVHTQNLQEWFNFKSLETRFVDYGTSKQQRLAYNKLSPANKLSYLQDKQRKHYEQQRHLLESGDNELFNETIAENISNLISSNDAMIDDPKTNEQHPKSSVVDELKQQNDERNTQQIFKNHLHKLNSTLHADVLLELAEKTHGVQPELYSITKNRDGADRIKCGNRNLSVVDFCTKELNLSFKEAVTLLDNAYNMQNDVNRARGWSIKQDIYLREQYKEWLKDYKSERLSHFKHTSTHAKDQRKSIIETTKVKIKLIRENTAITPRARAEQINILKAEQIIELKALTEARKHEQTSIHKAFNLEMQASYRKFLHEQAKLGDEIALEELRRLKIRFDKSQNETTNTFNYVSRYQEFRLNITHEIDNNGNICYKLDDKLIIKDTGKKIEVIHNTRENIKLTLELAMAKFGRSIELTGTADFREKVVKMAIQNNYKVEFLDEHSKQHHAKCLKQLNDNASTLNKNINEFAESSPYRCAITAVDSCGILDSNGRFKQVTYYKIKSMKDNKEFIMTNDSLDLLQQKGNLSSDQTYNIRYTDNEIKFSTSNIRIQQISQAQDIDDDFTL